MSTDKNKVTDSNNSRGNQDSGHSQSSGKLKQDTQEISGGISTISDKSRRDDGNISGRSNKEGQSETKNDNI